MPAWAIQGSATPPHISSTGIRLKPGVSESGQQISVRALKIGKLRSTDTDNLVWTGAFLRDYTPSGQSTLSEVGAVDAWRIHNHATPDISVFGSGLRPPNEPGTSAPQAGQTFGHSIALADVDGDGVNDLVASAHKYNGGRGRVYVYWGDNNSSNTYGLDPTLAQQKITAIDAPGVDSVFSSLNLQACNNPWGVFGLFLDAADIDGDGKADLIVGEPLYPQIGSSACNNYGGPTRVGRTHVYRGFQIQKPSSPGLLVSTALPRYTLVPPNRNNGTGPGPQTGENFGYYVWILDYDFDGDLDVIVHSETSNYSPPGGTTIPAAGSLYCYSNSPGSSGDILLDIDSLRRPKHWLYSSIPMTDARYGKWAEVGWWRVNATDPYERAFFVGEPDITVNGVRRSGRVVAYLQNGALAIPQQFEYTTYSIQEDARVTGDVFDFSAQGGPNATPQVMEAFGRWFAAANFSLSSGSDKRELIITASGRDVWQSGTQHVEAGAAKIVKAN